MSQGGDPWRGCVSLLGIVVCLSFVSPLATGAEPPLHERIDEQIAAHHAGAMAERASDAELLRRLYLDLTGRIPTTSAARAFLDDPSPNKREQLIDRLLASPAYARHMQRTFDVLLMERRADEHVPAAEWQEYLRSSFATNKPYDQLVREILSADGLDPAQRPAAKFYLDRAGETNIVVRDVSRIFLGMDLQCAQCHDHPLVDDYKQDYFYGLSAYLTRSFIFTGQDQPATIAEKAEGEVKFKSAFLDEPERQTGPRVLETTSLVEPAFAEGKSYVIAPAEGVRPQPRFSRRAFLATDLTSPENRQFSRTIVNRLWARMMGRGLIEPLHFDHSDNPPSHPELLDLLATEFTAGGFDLKALLRELARSQTYQRSSEWPADLDAQACPPESFAVANLKPLSPEQLAASTLEATGMSEAIRAEFEQQLRGDPRLGEVLAADEERRTLREEMSEQRLNAQLLGQLGQFVALFGNLPGERQDATEATVHQALYFSHDGGMASWLTPLGQNLAARAVSLSDPALACDEIVLSVLSRRSTTDEQQEFAHLLAAQGESGRATAVSEFIWALLASNEFRFNH
ncbi:MAG: DUF1549 domain-containing protein [Pirellulales bacterium]|nr:DUF1549 domain-containing protein [Pirellulales bacterium]